MPNDNRKKRTGKLPPGTLAKRATVVFVIYMIFIVSVIKIRRGRSEAGLDGLMNAAAPRQRHAVTVEVDPAMLLEEIATAPTGRGDARAYFHRGWISQQDGDFLEAIDDFQHSYALARHEQTQACFVSSWDQLFNSLDSVLLQIRADFVSWRYENVVLRAKWFNSTVEDVLRKGWLDPETEDRDVLAVCAEESFAYAELSQAHLAAARQDWDACSRYLDSCEKRLANLSQDRWEILQGYCDKLSDLAAARQE